MDNTRRTNRGAVELQRVLVARRMHKEQAAALLVLGKKSGQLSRLCSGERKPGRGLAFRIERLFGVPMSHWEEDVVVTETVEPAPKVA